MKFENGTRLEMIADEPDKKRGWNESAKNKCEDMSTDLGIARDEETN